FGSSGPSNRSVRSHATSSAPVSSVVAIRLTLLTDSGYEPVTDQGRLLGVRVVELLQHHTADTCVVVRRQSLDHVVHRAHEPAVAGPHGAPPAGAAVPGRP